MIRSGSEGGSESAWGVASRPAAADPAGVMLPSRMGPNGCYERTELGSYGCRGDRGPGLGGCGRCLEADPMCF